jgi:hypothetical protein
MALLMVALESILKQFGEVGRSNSEIRSKRKLGENEELEKESRNNP